MVEYQGWSEGTHTLRRAKWNELPVDVSSEEKAELTSLPNFHRDDTADNWLGKNVFGESVRGLIEGVLATNLLRVKKIIHA